MISIKLWALKAYSMEMREPPHSRSIAHVAVLAQHRGHCVVVDAAEAFMVIRRVKLSTDFEENTSKVTIEAASPMRLTTVVLVACTISLKIS